MLYQVYGQTEAVPVTMMGAKEWFAEVEGSNRCARRARPLPFAALEIRRRRARPLPIGETGEIALRCDGQMDGFWEDEAATRNGWSTAGSSPATSAGSTRTATSTSSTARTT